MKTIFNTVGNIIGLVVIVGIGIILVLTLRRTNPQNKQVPTFQSPIEKAIPTPTDTPTLTQFSSPIIPLSPTPTTLGLAIPTPKPTPTITDISVFTPIKTGELIMGYTFSTPNDIGIGDFTLQSWMPNKPNKIIVMGLTSLMSVDVTTGNTSILARWAPKIYETYAFNRKQIYITSDGDVFSILYNLDTNQYELWMGSKQTDSLQKTPLTNISPYFFFLHTSTNIAVNDINSKSVRMISDNGKSSISPVQFPQELFQFANTSPYYASKFEDRVIYYNQKETWLFSLIKNRVEKLKIDPSLRIWDIQWSGDGQKLALLLSRQKPTLSSKQLYIYDFTDNRIQKIDTPFTDYIDSVVWGADNRHVIVNAVVGSAEYKMPNKSIATDVDVLFLVDTITMDYVPLPFVSPDIASSLGRVLWSPDGKYLIVKYKFFEGKAQVYSIEVNQ